MESLTENRLNDIASARRFQFHERCFTQPLSELEHIKARNGAMELPKNRQWPTGREPLALIMFVFQQTKLLEYRAFLPIVYRCIIICCTYNNFMLNVQIKLTESVRYELRDSFSGLFSVFHRNEASNR